MASQAEAPLVQQRLPVLQESDVCPRKKARRVFRVRELCEDLVSRIGGSHEGLLPVKDWGILPTLVRPRAVLGLRQVHTKAPFQSRMGIFVEVRITKKRNGATVEANLNERTVDIAN